jgi:hypothetical protein
MSRPQGHSAAGRIKSTKNSKDTIRNQSRDLSTCNTVPQTSAPLRTPTNMWSWGGNKGTRTLATRSTKILLTDGLRFLKYHAVYTVIVTDVSKDLAASIFKAQETDVNCVDPQQGGINFPRKSTEICKSSYGPRLESSTPLREILNLTFRF